MLSSAPLVIHFPVDMQKVFIFVMANLQPEQNTEKTIKYN
jgi:hypothetical protein